MLRRWLQFGFLAALITLGVRRLNRLTDIPALDEQEATGDLKRTLVGRNGRPDPRLGEALKSVADLLEKSRKSSVTRAPASIDLPEELVAHFHDSPDQRTELVRDYVNGLSADDYRRKQQVLKLIKSAGPAWEPLSKEIALRILETPDPSSYAAPEAVAALSSAALAFENEDLGVKNRLWEQIRQLHAQPEALREISQSMRIELANTQNVSEAVNSNEHD